MRALNLAVLLVGLTLVVLGVRGVTSVDTSLRVAATHTLPVSQPEPCDGFGHGRDGGPRPGV
jgi:hypothetical protein